MHVRTTHTANMKGFYRGKIKGGKRGGGGGGGGGKGGGGVSPGPTISAREDKLAYI